MDNHLDRTPHVQCTKERIRKRKRKKEDTHVRLLRKYNVLYMASWPIATKGVKITSPGV